VAVGLHARDRSRLAGGEVVGPADQPRIGVGRAGVGVELALDRVHEVLGQDLAVERGGVADAAAELEGVGAAVVRELVRPVGQVGHRLQRAFALDAAVEGVQLPDHAAEQGEVEGGIGKAGVEGLDVAVAEDPQRPPFDPPARPAVAGVDSAAIAAGRGQQDEGGEQRHPPGGLHHTSMMPGPRD
jgi:hypothetical protein